MNRREMLATTAGLLGSAALPSESLSVYGIAPGQIEMVAVKPNELDGPFLINRTFTLWIAYEEDAWPAIDETMQERIDRRTGLEELIYGWNQEQANA